MNRWKRIVTLSMGLAVMGASALLAAEQWTGWITDQACAKAGKYAGSEHVKHVAEGQAVVFVNEKDNKVTRISNPDKVKHLTGEKVVLSGAAKSDGTIEAESAVRATP